MTCRLLALALFASFGFAHPPLAESATTFCSATTFTETRKDGSAFSGATRSGLRTADAAQSERDLNSESGRERD
jgi:hypothetical protein